MNKSLYGTSNREVKEVVEGPHFNLLEALANAVASKIFNTFKQITDVRVRIGKPAVAQKKNMDYVGIEIFRTSPSKRDVNGETE
jgi:dihydroneopterin aldolase